MKETPDWLPAMVLFEDYDGDWKTYLHALYEIFKSDFIRDRPVFRGNRMSLKKHPIIGGKEATFWHLITEGRTEANRVPDLQRCMRIRWPRPIIENCTDPVLKVWPNVRKGGKRMCLWFEEQEYLVVLAERRGYWLLWTAYLVTRPHRKRKLEAEYRRNRQS